MSAHPTGEARAAGAREAPTPFLAHHFPTMAAQAETSKLQAARSREGLPATGRG